MVYVNTADISAPKKISIPPLKEFSRRDISPVKVTAPTLSLANIEGSVSEKILGILTSKSVRRGPRSLIEPFLPELLSSIDRLVQNNQPINLILPSLPFKDQSPFTTGVSIDHADLCEHAMFAQIKRVVEAIATVYKSGAHMTLLCDGYIYADIFAQGDKDGAGRYKAACEKIKNEYGLHNQVTLFDMREVLFDMPEWHKVHSEILQIIQELKQNDPEVGDRLNVLSKQFIFHVALPEPHNSYEAARALYEQEPWPEWLTELMLNSAIEYCAIHLTLAHTDLVTRAFPSAIRCTVHPKAAAQIPLHLTNPDNSLLPYNGIATVSLLEYQKGKSLFEALRVRRLCDVMTLPNVTAIHVTGDSHPFYYEIG